MAAMLSAKASMRGAAVAAAAPRRAARAASARLQVSAHCQVPCGIFDDAKQLAKLKEVGDCRGGGARARALVAPRLGIGQPAQGLCFCGAGAR